MHIHSFRVEPGTQSTAPVREWLGELLVDSSLTSLVPDAQLLVTELINNTLIHVPGGRADVTAVIKPDEVEVHVFDQSSRHPVVCAPAPEELGGRGMLIVDRLADRWGCEPLGVGKRVWFALKDTA